MKRFRFILVILVCCMFGTLCVEAKKNPYPHYEDLGFGKIVNCTWYAWEQTKIRKGIELPTWYNVWTWHIKAKKAGFSTGKEPRKDSLMIWNYGDDFGGHVAYVTNVSGNTITYDEGGAMNSTGIATNQTITLEEIKVVTTDYGFIYLDVPVSTTTKKTSTMKSTTEKSTIAKKTTTSITTEKTTKESTSTEVTTSSVRTKMEDEQTTSNINEKRQDDKVSQEKNNYIYIVVGVVAGLVLIIWMIKKYKD